MEANIVPLSLCLQSSSFLLRRSPHKIQTFLTPGPVMHFQLPRLRATSEGTESSSGTRNDDQIITNNNVAASTTTTNDNNDKNTSRWPPGTLNIKYRRRSRKQARKQQERRSPPPPKKDWESMTLGEKAVELYVGDKGLLFWLNKFAYASIFIVIGGWILFRFVGPSLGLYQLDTPPLSPTSIFKESS